MGILEQVKSGLYTPTQFESFLDSYFDFGNGKEMMDKLVLSHPFSTEQTIDWPQDKTSLVWTDTSHSGSLASFAPNWKEEGFSFDELIHLIKTNIDEFKNDERFSRELFEKDAVKFLLFNSRFKFILKNKIAAEIEKKFKIYTAKVFFQRRDNETGGYEYIIRINRAKIRNTVTSVCWNKLSDKDIAQLVTDEVEIKDCQMPREKFCDRLRELGRCTIAIIEKRKGYTCYIIQETGEIWLQGVKLDKMFDSEKTYSSIKNKPELIAKFIYRIPKYLLRFYNQRTFLLNEKIVAEIDEKECGKTRAMRYIVEYHFIDDNIPQEEKEQEYEKMKKYVEQKGSRYTLAKYCKNQKEL